MCLGAHSILFHTARTLPTIRCQTVELNSWNSVLHLRSVRAMSRPRGEALLDINLNRWYNMRTRIISDSNLEAVIRKGEKSRIIGTIIKEEEKKRQRRVFRLDLEVIFYVYPRRTWGGKHYEHLGTWMWLQARVEKGQTYSNYRPCGIRLEQPAVFVLSVSWTLNLSWAVRPLRRISMRGLWWNSNWYVKFLGASLIKENNIG